MSQPTHTRKLFWRIGAVSVVATVVLGVLLAIQPRPADNPAPPPPPQELPDPPFTESAFLTTRPDTRYIGTAACASCHKTQHQSYLLTAHSRALSDVDPSTEPDGAFPNKASGRSYRVYHRNGQLHHEETLAAPDGTVIARMDLPVRYQIGSGRHARAYAVEVDGFLHESPITWYSEKNKWDMSPGYDVPNNGSFERPIMLECLACHAGRVAEVDGGINRLNITEKAIGCESCHGPGSRHQEFHRTQKLVPGATDTTIVHPGKLPRPLLESICSSCHLGEPALVPVRGRQISDFLPGRPLRDYRTHYHLEGANGLMTVVGHVDQLHESACYKKSPTMTCLSCHDPHQHAKPANPVAYFRDKCLNCHDTHPCKLEPAQRLKREPMDNCVSCHMPRGDTDVPHVAFTHHRIGLHPQAQPTGPQPTPELVATDDLSWLAPPDRERNLGLAYQIVRESPTFAPYANEFRDRARTHLLAAYDGGLRDAETVMGLAELDWRSDRARAIEYAREGLAARDVTPRIRSRALWILAHGDLQNDNVPGAITTLEELGRIRRFADDWRLLGACDLHENVPEKAVAALKKSLEIRPYRAATHSALADAYARLGQRALAEEHYEKARWLRQHNQD